jgi:hypothetical protein
MRLALSLLGLLILLLSASWVLIPMLAGSPWVPNAPRRIRRALQMAGVAPGETVYDLGAGDGRVLWIAAGEFGASAVGVEIEPVRCVLIWLKAHFNSFGRRISIHWGSFYHLDLGEADVVFVYLTTPQVTRLREYLEQQLQPGARLVSVAADFDGWQPQAVDKEEMVFLYRMPPVPGNLASYLAQKRASENSQPGVL